MRKIIKMKNDIYPQKLLSDLNTRIKYHPDTGDFIWIVSTGKAKALSKAGSTYKNGYVYIQLNNKSYRAHRLAWLLTYGNFPTKDIDHKDGNKANNSIDNLREVTKEQNNQNKFSARKDNKLGVLGVTFRYGKFLSHIKKNGKRTFIGKFETIEEASNAYIEAKRNLHQDAYFEQLNTKG